MRAGALSICGILLLALAGLARAEGRATLVLVTGAPGSPEYGEAFARWTGFWQKAGERAGAGVRLLGQDEAADGPSDRERFQALLEEEEAHGEGELWLVFHGHGTFDGRNAKFNLRGPDVSAGDLSGWLSGFQRPLVLVSGFSASAPFIEALSGPGRLILSATRSGHQNSYSRFGGFLAGALEDPEADLDRDDQVSLLEAFLMASRKTGAFYEAEGRLATEHALLEDTGDRRGVEADWFRGVRAIRESRDGSRPDGRRAHQFHLIPSAFEAALPEELRRERDELEMELLDLRDAKDSMDSAEYYRELEGVLVQLSEIYLRAESLMGGDPGE